MIRVVATAVLVIALVVNLGIFLSDPQDMIGLLPFWAFIALIFLLSFYGRHKGWSQLKARGTMTIVLSDAGVEAREATMQTHYEWQAVRRWVELPAMFLLEVRPRCFVPILKRALVPHSEEQIRELVASHCGQ